MRPDIKLMDARQPGHGTAKLQLGELARAAFTTAAQFFFAPNPDNFANSLQPQQKPTRTEPGLNPEWPGNNPENPGPSPDKSGPTRNLTTIP